MSMDNTSILDELLAATSSKSDEFRRGFEAGHQKAREELQGQIEKVASAAVADVVQELERLEAFKGQVAIHAAGREIARFKQSMQAGMCWQCGIRAPSHASAYRLCSDCDQ